MSFGLHSEEIKAYGNATSEEIADRSNIMNNKLKKIFEETGYEHYLSSDTEDNYIYLNKELTLGIRFIDSNIINTDMVGLVDIEIKKENNKFVYPLQYSPAPGSSGKQTYGFCFSHNSTSDFSPAYDFVYKISMNKKALIVGINAVGFVDVRRDFLPLIFTKDQENNNSIIFIYGYAVFYSNAFSYSDVSTLEQSGQICIVTDKQDIGYGEDYGFLNTFRAEPTAPTTMIRMPTIYSESYFPDVYYILSAPEFTNNLSNIIAIGDKRYQICYSPGAVYGPLLAVEVGDD